MKNVTPKEAYREFDKQTKRELEEAEIRNCPVRGPLIKKLEEETCKIRKEFVDYFMNDEGTGAIRMMNATIKFRRTMTPLETLKKETKMKATIQKVELFEIEIFGVVHKNFEKVETWKNLACYKNKDGEIVASDYGDEKPFDWVFRHLDNSPSKPQEIIVISATPFFINTANSNAK